MSTKGTPSPDRGLQSFIIQLLTSRPLGISERESDEQSSVAGATFESVTGIKATVG